MTLSMYTSMGWLSVSSSSPAAWPRKLNTTQADHLADNVRGALLGVLDGIANQACALPDT